MPLAEFQSALARLLAVNRSPDSHLAGGAALHFEPNSQRYSNDLDYFHDSEERVASAFAADQELLSQNNYIVEIDLNRPGYVRATVSRGGKSTKVEWAHDSAWRFMPAQQHEHSGYQLHPVDLAINKVLALAGRDEARDYLDVLHADANILPLGALCWAAVGKDPGFTPTSLLEMLKRRGKYRPEDFERLHLAKKVDLVELKQRWLTILDEASDYIARGNPKEIGCLYFDRSAGKFTASAPDAQRVNIVPHFGRPGGVLPAIGEQA